MRLLIIAILLQFSLNAQQPLSIGDTLPAKWIATLNNNLLPGTSNFKSQISNGCIILDFFATYCTACIRELPKLDSLQQLFSNNIQIIIVAHEPWQKINALKKKNEVFANCKLPLIAGDSILNDLFPHQYLPHEV